jgi:hypothetical protein
MCNVDCNYTLDIATNEAFDLMQHRFLINLFLITKPKTT